MTASRGVYGKVGRDLHTAQQKGEETNRRIAQISLAFLAWCLCLRLSVPGTGGVMADWEGIPARERRQMEEILQLDMEELNVEVVDDNEEDEEEEEGDGNEEDDDIDAFLR